MDLQGFHKFKLNGQMLEKHLFESLTYTKVLTNNISFASRLNNQLPTYISYKPDLNAYGANVWKHLKFYYFLSFSCITRLQKSIKKRAKVP